MFRTELSPEIWLSTNSVRVCTLAFGNSFSAWSSAARFASVSPPFMITNE